MRVPEQVLELARSRYRKSWRDWLVQDRTIDLSFSLSAPTAQVIARQSDAVGVWTKGWRNWLDANPAARPRRTTRRTVVGDQEVFTHLDMTTVDDLVALDPDLQEHWQRATERWARLQQLPSHVQAERLRPWLNQLVGLDEADFGTLVQAVLWFFENPRSGQTIRQVPVLGMHTKWLAHHRRLVLACLNLTDQAAADPSGLEDGELEQQVLDVLGLKALPVHVDLILADPEYRRRVGGLKHLRVPQPEAGALPVQPELVVIVENKESAYALPDIADTVVIHSLGNHLNILGEIGWIHGVRQLYWGDLDRAGFTMLSRARALLPRVVSVLMDLATLEKHIALSVVDESRADVPEANLTPDELVTLAALTKSSGEHLRLEQERVPETFVLRSFAAITDAIEPRSPKVPRRQDT